MITRPVLFCDIDDVGTVLLDKARSNGWVPLLDALIPNARYYSRFWAADMCSPFRARVMTGLDPYREGNLVGDILHPNDPYELPTGATLVQGMPGFKTKRGKWHLAGGASPDPPTHPIRCGFNEWSGSRRNLGTSYYQWLKSESDESGEVKEWHELEYATLNTAKDLLFDIERGVDFIHASFNAVHTPLELPPGDYPPTNHGPTLRFYMLNYLDGVLAGNVLPEAVRRGYVCIVACDNGTQGQGKHTLFERGIRTPMFILGKGIKQGVSDRLVQATDLYSTIRLLRGAPTVDVVDSFDFVEDFLERPGHTSPPPREYLSCDAFLRNGHQPPKKWRRTVRNDRWKIIRDRNDHDMLFDLLQDPDEGYDLIPGLDGEAEVAYEKLRGFLPGLGTE